MLWYVIDNNIPAVGEYWACPVFISKSRYFSHEGEKRFRCLRYIMVRPRCKLVMCNGAPFSILQRKYELMKKASIAEYNHCSYKNTFNGGDVSPFELTPSFKKPLDGGGVSPTKLLPCSQNFQIRNGCHSLLSFDES